MTSLHPTAPPGRTSRKARGFAAEIARLRRQGYTLDAIRQALIDAGIEVSVSTVWREARRVDVQAQALAVAMPSPVMVPTRNVQDGPQAQASAAAGRQAARMSPAVAGTPTLVPCSGKKLADLFMSSQITNPLFRSKE